MSAGAQGTYSTSPSICQSTRLPVCPSTLPECRPQCNQNKPGVTVSCGPSYADQPKPSTDLPTSKAQARLMPTLDDGWLSASTVQLTLCLARKTHCSLVDGLPPVSQDPNRM